MFNLNVSDIVAQVVFLGVIAVSVLAFIGPVIYAAV